MTSVTLVSDLFSITSQLRAIHIFSLLFHQLGKQIWSSSFHKHNLTLLVLRLLLRKSFTTIQPKNINSTVPLDWAQTKKTIFNFVNVCRDFNLSNIDCDLVDLSASEFLSRRGWGNISVQFDHRPSWTVSNVLAFLKCMLIQAFMSFSTRNRFIRITVTVVLAFHKCNTFLLGLIKAFVFS